MSGDPPGGLLGSVGRFFRGRFSEKLKNFWWSQNGSRTLPGAFLASLRKKNFQAKIRVQMMTVGRFASGAQSIFATSGRNHLSVSKFNWEPPLGFEWMRKVMRKVDAQKLFTPPIVFLDTVFCV